LGKLDLSLNNYEESLRIFEKICGRKHFRVADCLNNIGNIYENKKNFLKAK
jgi:hypothetical protein